MENENFPYTFLILCVIVVLFQDMGICRFTTYTTRQDGTRDPRVDIQMGNFIFRLLHMQSALLLRFLASARKTRAYLAHTDGVTGGT